MVIIPVHIRASVLATIMVIAVIMLLVVLALISLWEADFLLFSRTNYMRIQRANIESTYTLYRNYPEATISNLASDSTIMLYDSLPSSCMKLSRKPWGLYEVVSVATADGRQRRSQIMGLADPSSLKCNFWYRNNKSSITVTGNTFIQGVAYLPRNGVVYGQMQSVFFKGTKLDENIIKVSEESLPKPSERSIAVVNSIFDYLKMPLSVEPVDSISYAFYGNEPMVVKIGSGSIANKHISGNIILVGDKLRIKRSCHMSDVIVVARQVTVDDGFEGAVQIFTTDSLTIGENVTLNYPSGAYSRNYAELGDHSTLNGYMIVDYDGKVDLKKPNCRKSRLSRLRGLLYTRGITQLQGIVTGAAFIDEAIYYAPHGYYRNMIYDATILENKQIIYPLWLDRTDDRKEIKWVQ